jgi:hypothetical protein
LEPVRAPLLGRSYLKDVESAPVIRIQWRTQGDAARQIGICDEQPAEGNGIGITALQNSFCIRRLVPTRGGTRSSNQTLVVAKKFQAGDIFMISGTSSLDSNRL